MRKQKYLYHITDRKSAEKILKDKRIEPRVGDNSHLTDDTQPAVFLSDRKSIPYWKQLLDKSTVIRIPMEDVNGYETFEYSLYSEYECENAVCSENMQITYVKNEDVNRELCEAYLYTINNICSLCAKYRSNPDKDEKTEEIIKETIRPYLGILRRLKYNRLTKDEWGEIRYNLIDSCCCALSDHYNMTEKRIWQLLGEPDPKESEDLRQARSEMYEFIAGNLKPILYAKTGGWNF